MNGFVSFKSYLNRTALLYKFQRMVPASITNFLNSSNPVSSSPSRTSHDVHPCILSQTSGQKKAESSCTQTNQVISTSISTFKVIAQSQPDLTVHYSDGQPKTSIELLPDGTSRLQPSGQEMLLQPQLTLGFPRHPVTPNLTNIDSMESMSKFHMSEMGASVSRLNAIVQYPISDQDSTRLLISSSISTMPLNSPSLRPIKITSSRAQLRASEGIELASSSFIPESQQAITSAIDRPHEQGLLPHDTFTGGSGGSMDKMSVLWTAKRHDNFTRLKSDHSSSITSSSTGNQVFSVPSVLTTSPLATTHSVTDGAQFSRSLPKKSLGAILGSILGAVVIACCIIVFHRSCYQWIARAKSRGLVMNARQRRSQRNTLLGSRQSPRPEISRFSADS